MLMNVVKMQLQFLFEPIYSKCDSEVFSKIWKNRTNTMTDEPLKCALSTRVGAYLIVPGSNLTKTLKHILLE